MSQENGSERIDSCFDSHVHWAATGEFAERLRLESLTAAGDLLKISRPTAPLADNWILGFGWNESNWPDKNLLNRQWLDRWSPDQPVLFTRVDGHCGWVNTQALKMAGWIN